MTCGDSSGFVFFFLSLSLCNWNITLPEISIYKVFPLAEPWDFLLVDLFFLSKNILLSICFFFSKNM